MKKIDRTQLNLTAAQFVLVPLLLAASSLSCKSKEQSGVEAASASRPVVLATTTSVYDTGLLELLLPEFTEEFGYPVKPLAVGSGQALALASRGEVDLLLVHAPAAEKRFVDEGHGRERSAFAHNDFVIVGPPDDPAGVREATSVAEALALVRKAGLESKARFISRGDQSGTHKKERSLWSSANLEPDAEGEGSKWYVEAGVGQAAMLTVADQKEAYALTDRSTYLFLQERLQLEIVYEGGDELLNRYSVVTVNAERHTGINEPGALALRRFLLSSAVQEKVRAFGEERFGRPLFYPDALDAGSPAER